MNGRIKKLKRATTRQTGRVLLLTKSERSQERTRPERQEDYPKGEMQLDRSLTLNEG